MSLFRGLAPNWGLNPLLESQSSASGVMVSCTPSGGRGGGWDGDGYDDYGNSSCRGDE
jgi:hypothetical protein